MVTPSRPLDVFLPVAGRYDLIARRFRDDPITWLPTTGQSRPGSWHIDVTAGGFTHPVECRVGPVRVRSGAVWRSIAWTPAALSAGPIPVERMLPTLDAELGAVDKREGPTMVLTGTYTVPAGVLGVVADLAGLHRVARTSAKHFVEDVARRLTDPNHASREMGA